MTFTDTDLAQAKSTFKTLGLSQEQAQKLIDLRAQQVQAGNEAANQAWTQQVSAWETELKTDKDFGGANYDKSVQTALVGINKFGSPALLTLLQDSGLIKNPEILRTFARIGARLKEDNPGAHNITGVNGNGQGKSLEERAIDVMYPKTT